MKWQPIETAPKNGRHILLASSDEMAECYWNRLCGWWEYADGDQFLYMTHWMPLPDPPAKAESGKKGT